MKERNYEIMELWYYDIVEKYYQKIPAIFGGDIESGLQQYTLLVHGASSPLVTGNTG